MNECLASVIIPLWNGRNYIEACLSSVLAQNYAPLEAIVVDNASEDGSADLVAEKFPSVRLIRNGRNLGFAGGVNAGLRAAKGQVLIFFNQDAVAEPGWLSALAAGLLAAPDIGVAGCKILNVDAPILQHAGGCLIMPQAQPSHIGLGQVDAGQYEQLTDVNYVTGAALALRHEVLDTIGYLDETFFFYYEDVDYCYRARAAGFRVVYVPQAVVYHHGNTSLGVGTMSHHANLHASRLQFVLKHWGAPYFISEFQPAEQGWFRQINSPEERVGLRKAYQTMILKIARQHDYECQTELLAALCHLRQQVYAAYVNEVWHPLDEPPGLLEKLAERWWEVRERPFVSHTPVIGSLIARFRTLWNDVSTKWFVRLILQQQNEVNHLLAQHLERQRQILYTQGQMLQNFDSEQAYLTTQLIEVIHRLDKIEARLMALEQK